MPAVIGIRPGHVFKKEIKVRQKYFKYSGNRLPQNNLVVKADFRIRQAVKLIACMIKKIVKFTFMFCCIYNYSIFRDFLNCRGLVLSHLHTREEKLKY